MGANVVIFYDPCKPLSNYFSAQSFSTVFTHHFVDNQRNSSVAGDIAGCSETIHRNVKRNHQSLCRFIEAEHGLQDSQSSHDSPARNARCSHHRDSQHKDKTGKKVPMAIPRMMAITMRANKPILIFFILAFICCPQK